MYSRLVPYAMPLLGIEAREVVEQRHVPCMHHGEV